MKSSALRGVRLLLVTCVLSIAAAPLALAGTAFSKIIVFGDSLEDFGNMVQFTGGVFPNAPLYVYGRQSNGPVWIEHLANRLAMTHQVQNYAVVGALLNPRPGFPTGNAWSDTYPGLEGTDVTTQVQEYLAEVNGHAAPDALYILGGGPNDFPRVANPAVIVTDIAALFVRLQMAGAKHVLVVALPDFGRIPRRGQIRQRGCSGMTFIPPPACISSSPRTRSTA